MRYRAKSVGLGDMNTSPTQFAIPGDLASCHALIEQLAMTIEESSQKIAKLEQEKQEIQLAFAELLQRAFRNRSERYVHNPDQLRLDFNNTEDAADAAAGLAEAIEEARPQEEQVIAEHTRRRPRRQRQENLPEHLDRVVVEAEAGVVAAAAGRRRRRFPSTRLRRNFNRLWALGVGLCHAQ